MPGYAIAAICYCALPVFVAYKFGKYGLFLAFCLVMFIAVFAGSPTFLIINIIATSIGGYIGLKISNWKY